MKLPSRVGRPRKSCQEKGKITPIRLNAYYRQGISEIHEKGLAASIRQLYDEYQSWLKAKQEIKNKLEEKSKIFIQAFSLFMQANQLKKKDEAEILKEKIFRSAQELKFFSDLLNDSHFFLQQTQGHIHFRHLQDVWKLTRISD